MNLINEIYIYIYIPICVIYIMFQRDICHIFNLQGGSFEKISPEGRRPEGDIFLKLPTCRLYIWHISQ